MQKKSLFPSLKNWEPTRDTLHWYINSIAVTTRAHADFLPRWWHITLKVFPNYLATDEMRLPEGGSFKLSIDFNTHQLILSTTTGIHCQFSLDAGYTATEFGNNLLSALQDLNLSAIYERDRYYNDDVRLYNRTDAENYFSVLKNVDRIFNKHRSQLVGEVGPVQLWPKDFDLAFEWFGSRMITVPEKNNTLQKPAQLNLGFSPGDKSHPDPYFYSNPWPFEEEILTKNLLPQGARWYIDTWKGTILPYAELVDDENAENRLLEYARSVFNICYPHLISK